MIRYVFILISLAVAFNATGQMIVENDLTPSQLINDILLGEGIDAQNITMNGNASEATNMQFGYFDATNSNIGISTGIILATGGVHVAVGPNDIPTAFVTVPEADELTSEPDLEEIISPAELNDAAVVEFDFTAKGDTLRFTYVFASEEYNDHTCSPYNDAFGFFISGPGIVGDGIYEHNAKNVALIPDKQIPVAINTVNQGFAGQYGSNSVCDAVSEDWIENSVYFIDNSGNTDMSATQFDGFTVPFLVEIPVVCGSTYHIKLAIGDAVDGKNDSAVFFEAGSFESEAPMEAELSIVDPNDDGYAQEGCSKLNLRLERSDSTSIKTVYVTTQGFQDVTTLIPDLPDSINFYPHQGIVNLDLEIFDNGTFESLRNAAIILLEPEVCSVDTAVTPLTFPLFDVGGLSVVYPNDIALNCDEIASIDIQVSGGNPPYSVNWEDGYQGLSFDVSPESELFLTGTVRDQCGINQENISIHVFREAYDSLTVIVPETVNYNCSDLVLIEPLVSGGIGNYSYEWLIGAETVSTNPIFEENISSDSDIVLRVTDQCMPQVESMIIANSVLNPIVVNLGADTSATCAENITLVPEVYGGFGDLQLIWKLNQFPISSASTYTFMPSQTSIVSLEASDECGQSTSDDIVVYMNEPPIHLNLASDTTICEGDHLFLEPNVIGGFGELEYTWDNIPSEDGVLSEFPEETTTYVLDISDECGRTFTHEYRVGVRQVESLFSFNYENQIQLIDNQSTLDCEYDWTFADESHSEVYEPFIEIESLKGGYTYLKVVNDIGCEATSRVRFEPVHSIFIPNAFSPDGDGLNDLFKAEGIYISEFEISIYDRWGLLMYHSTDINQGWDGHGGHGTSHTAQDHIYSYKYVVKSWTGEVEEGIGVIHMIR